MKIRHDRLATMAEKAYSRHAIIRRADRSWLLMQPEATVKFGAGDSCYWTEIVCLLRGTIVVHGDGPDLMFRNYRDRNTPEAQIRWLAGSDLEYLGSKLCNQELRQVWDADVADHHLTGLIAEYEQEAADNADIAETVTDLRWLQGRMDAGQVYIHERIYEITEDGDLASEFGMDLNPQLFYAHAAAKRLVYLLDREHRT